MSNSTIKTVQTIPTNELNDNLFKKINKKTVEIPHVELLAKEDPFVEERLLRSLSLKKPVSSQAYLASNVPEFEQDDLQFAQFHMPKAPAGTYKIETEQIVELDSRLTSKLEQKVEVKGKRNLTTLIHSTYPPQNESGSYEDVLPHIIFNKSTYPWEFQSIVAEETEDINSDRMHNKPSALMLILLDEEESKMLKVTKKRPEGAKLQDGIKDIYPNEDRQEGSSDNEGQSLFSYLTIPTKSEELDKFIELLPQTSDIQYLAHTTMTNFQKVIGKNGQQELLPKEEMATIICNRLPKPDVDNQKKQYTAHLIAIDNIVFPNIKNTNQLKPTTDSDSKTAWKSLFNTLSGQDKYLLSLYSWSFTSISNDEKGLIKQLKELSCAPLRMKIENEINTELKEVFSRGFVPMPHFLRKGHKAISWYHGPLVPIFSQLTAIQVENGTSPDDYLQYLKLKNNNYLDVSYSAAWQLGQNLTLNNKHIALQIYKDYRNALLKQERANNSKSVINKFSETTDKGSVGYSSEVVKWCKELMELSHIPFNYIVADSSVLPKESIRFFRIDNSWMNVLIEGALSVGKEAHEIGYKTTSRKDIDTDNVNVKIGFLIRSQIITDYPDLHFELQKAGNTFYKWPTSTRKLGGDVLLVVYDEKTELSNSLSIGVYGKVRGLHFGFTLDNGKLSKTLRKTTASDRGKKGDTKLVLDGYIKNNSCVNITQMVDKLEEKNTDTDKMNIIKYNSANFAFHMTEGTNAVRLHLKKQE